MAVTTKTGGTGPQYSAANWAPIPAQQQKWLKQLSNSGKLSGISPEYLAAIDWAESNGMGGGVNSSNYGGWFGLKANTQYPSGSITPAQLTGTDKASFDAQAMTSAGLLASLIKANNGNVYAAEQQYQGGGSLQGVKVMQQYGLGPVVDPSTLTAPPTVGPDGTSTAPGSLMGACNKGKCIIGTPFGVGGCLMDECQAKALVSGLLVLGGAFVMLVGVAVLATSTKAGRTLMSVAPVGFAAEKLMKGGGKVTEKKAQTRETAAYNRGHAEGKKMASQGSSVPKGSSYKPRPEDADFAVEA